MANPAQALDGKFERFCLCMVTPTGAIKSSTFENTNSVEEVIYENAFHPFPDFNFESKSIADDRSRLGVYSESARAAGNLPWEAPLIAIATSLTGPIAYAIGLIGIAIAGGTMLWGGELSEFGRRACMIGLVVSVLVFAAPLLSSAFGVNAAVV
jgi:type IV secretion system protein VirB2